MQVVIRISSGLAPPRSWSKWWLLGLGSLVILSAYRFEYAYAALVFHSTFMTIYTGILSFVPLIPLVTQSTQAQAPVRLYRHLECFTREFYAPVRHHVQLLWKACLSLSDKSLLWYHRTSTVVVDWNRRAICAAAWFAKVCWTVIRATYKLFEDLPSPSLSPDHATVLEPSPKLPGSWITEQETSDPLFSPNNAPASPVGSTSWFTTCSPEPLPPPQPERQMGVSRGRKKSEPQSPAPPQSVSLAPSSLTVKEVVETKGKLDCISLGPVHAPMPVPSTLYRPVEGSIRKRASLHNRAKDTVKISSLKSPHSKVKTASGLSGSSLLSSPPRKKLHSVNPRQIGVATPAHGLEVEKNGVNVATTDPEQTRVPRSVSATPAVPTLRALWSPVVTTDITVATLSVSNSPRSLSAPNGPPRANVSRQEATTQVPAPNITCLTPPQQIRSITTIDQSLLHTNWSPSVAAPNSNEPILQSGTGTARQTGVSTAGVDSLAHVPSLPTRQTSAQGKQHPPPSGMASTVSLWPTLQPGFMATNVRQVASNVDGDVHMTSSMVPSTQTCLVPATQSDVEMRNSDTLAQGTLEGETSSMDLDSLPPVRPSPLANALFPRPVVNPFLHFTWKSDNSSTTPVSMDLPSAESVLDGLEDVHMVDAECSTYPQSLAPPIAVGLPFNLHQLHPPSAIHQTEASVTPSVTTQTFLSTSVSVPVAHTNASSVSHTFEAMQHYADPLQKENTSTRHEEEKYVADALLALCELPPGSLNVAAEPRANPFARSSNRSRVSRPQERLGRNHKGRTRLPRAGPITPVGTSQGPTHNLHGLGGTFEGHNVHVAPSVCASGVAHDRRGGIASEIQWSSPPTIVPSSQPTPLITKAPPSSPVVGYSGLLHTFPVPSIPVRTTTLSPSSSSAVIAQKPNTKRQTTQNVRNNSALHECSGYLQQVEAASSLDPSSNVIAQSSHSQRIPHTTSNVEASSDLLPSLITRPPVAQRLSVAPPSTPVPSSSSTASSIFDRCLANAPVTRLSSNRQHRSSPVDQSMGITVPVIQRKPSSLHRPRPKWMDDDERQEEKENEEREKLEKARFIWDAPPRKNENRRR